MVPIINNLRKEYKNKITIVTFNADIISEEEVLKAEKIFRIPTLRFVNSKNEITAEFTGANRNRIKEETIKLF